MICPDCKNANPPGAAFCGVCSQVLIRALPLNSRDKPPPPKPPSPVPHILVGITLFLVFVAGRDRIREALAILEWVNIALHEGGHVVFGILGIRFIMVLGGTAMQLLLPAAFAVQFWKRRAFMSADVCLFWVGENFLGIGRYIADARAQQLDLLAGGVHDWTYLLDVVGLLTHDVGLGLAAQFLGCLIMAVAAAAGYWHFARRRA